MPEDKDFINLDCTGLRAPLPILKVTLAVKKMERGQVLRINGDCPDLERDLLAWAHRTYNNYQGKDEQGRYLLKKER